MVTYRLKDYKVRKGADYNNHKDFLIAILEKKRKEHYNLHLIFEQRP